MATLARYSLPLPGLGYAIALLVEIGAGVAFLIGWRGRAAALLLAFWCVATAFVMHYHPVDRAQMFNVLAYLCMAGGFLQVFVNGTGAFSADRGG